MKYCVVIMDGASGLPLEEYGGKTTLELSSTPNLDLLASEGTLGLARTIPSGMEPSSACGCMSVLGYDPKLYYRGRAIIEAKSREIELEEGEVVFRCNLVAVRDGKMWSYSAGYISTEEARELIKALNEELGSERIRFYPGISYRHILKLKGFEETLKATCTPPHDIPDKPIKEYLPQGEGSEILRELMERSQAILANHPVNQARVERGEIPASMIWLFWGSGRVPELPPFREVYGVSAAITSGVDLLRGLARILGIEVLKIEGVTDGQDNDYHAQGRGALEALGWHDMVIIHVEAPDEASHDASVEKKRKAIEKIDSEIIAQLKDYEDKLRLLIMPDHSTPIKVRTHTPDPVPFLLWGEGFASNGARRFTEREASKTGLFVEEGYNIMSKLVGLRWR